MLVYHLCRMFCPYTPSKFAQSVELLRFRAQDLTLCPVPVVLTCEAL